MCGEVAAINGTAKFRMPSTKFPKIYPFGESVITPSGAPCTFTRWTDATATDFNNVITSDLLVANNTATTVEWAWT